MLIKYASLSEIEAGVDPCKELFLCVFCIVENNPSLTEFEAGLYITGIPAMQIIMMYAY